MKRLLLLCLGLIIFAAAMSAAPASASLNDGLISYFPFDTNYNSVVGKKKVTGTPKGKVVLRNGLIGKAAYFDGKTALIEYGSKVDLDRSFTVAFWIKPTRAHGNAGIINRVKSNGNGYNFNLNGYNPAFWAGSSKETFNVKSKKNVAPNRWSHLVYVSNDRMMTIYLNGRIVGKGRYGFYPTWFGKASMGCQLSSRTNSKIWYEGYLDEVRIWDRPLSGNEANAVFASGRKALAAAQAAANKRRAAEQKRRAAEAAKRMASLKTPVKNGLVFYMPFDRNLNDLVGGVNGQTEGGSVQKVAGTKGGAYYFDATQTRIDVGRGLNLSGDYSVVYWIKSRGRRGNAGILNKVNSKGDGYNFELRGLKPVFWSGVVKGRNTDVLSSKSVPAGRWTQVAFISQAGVMNIYINGVRTGTGKYARPRISSDPVTIGVQLNSWRKKAKMAYEGSLDELRVYNRALSVSELWTLISSDNPKLAAVAAEKRKRAEEEARRRAEEKRRHAEEQRRAYADAKQLAGNINVHNLAQSMSAYRNVRGYYNKNTGYGLIPAYKVSGATFMDYKSRWHRARIEIFGVDRTASATHVYVKFTPYWDYNGKYTKFSLRQYPSGANCMNFDFVLRVGGKTYKNVTWHPYNPEKVYYNNSFVSMLVFPRVPGNMENMILDSVQWYKSVDIGPFSATLHGTPASALGAGIARAVRDGGLAALEKIGPLMGKLSYNFAYDREIILAVKDSVRKLSRTANSGTMKRLAAVVNGPLGKFITDRDKANFQNAYSQQMARDAGIVFRHTFRYGTIGTRYVPVIANKKRVVVDSYYVGSHKVEKYKYKNVYSGGNSQTRKGYTAIYQFINESSNYYVASLDIKTTTKLTNYEVNRSSWGDSRKLSNKWIPIKKRVTYILKPGESLKDELKVGETKPRDFSVSIRSLSKVSSDWINGLYKALDKGGKAEGFLSMFSDPYQGKIALIQKYLKDSRAAKWHGLLRAELDRTVMEAYSKKLDVDVEFDKYYDKDFESKVYLAIENDSDRTLKVTYKTPKGAVTRILKPSQTYNKTIKTVGVPKDKFTVKIVKVRLAD